MNNKFQHITFKYTLWLQLTDVDRRHHNYHFYIIQAWTRTLQTRQGKRRSLQLPSSYVGSGSAISAVSKRPKGGGGGSGLDDPARRVARYNLG